jgi:hypothetical protein
MTFGTKKKWTNKTGGLLISHWGIISLSQMISRIELISHWGIISLSQMISRIKLISHWGIITFK